MEELNEKTINSGDRLYIINEVEKCALTATGIIATSPLNYNLELVTTKKLPNASIWQFKRKTFNKKDGFQLIVQSQTAKDKDKYLAYGYRSNIEKYKAGHLISEGKEEYNVFFAQDKSGNNVPINELKYGTPYRIYNSKFYNEKEGNKSNIYLGLEKFDSLTRASMIGYDKDLLYWIFLPADIQGGLDAECVYADYLTGRGRCVESRFDIYNRCANQLNNYCSFKQLGEDKVCTKYMQTNPNGKADQLIRDICQEGTNFRNPLCFCVGPLKFKKYASSVPGLYENEWYCNSDLCISNKKDAFKLSIQNGNCPPKNPCYYTETLDNGAIVLKRNLDCEGERNDNDNDDNNNHDDNDDDNTDTTDDDDEKRLKELKNKNKKIIILSIVGLAIGSGIIIFLLMRDSNKE